MSIKLVKIGVLIFYPSNIPSGVFPRKFVSTLLFPFYRPQAAQNCGSYSFNTRINILTALHCTHHSLLIDSKKSLQRPQTSKVSMNADITETIYVCHDHSNAHKPPKTCVTHNFHARKKIVSEVY